MTKIFGLTGGLASGKSTVASMFRDMGAVIIDADQIARQVVQPGEIAYQQLVSLFGNQILENPNQPHSPIHRAKLADLVFSNPEARQQINQIIHPQIVKQSSLQISTLQEQKVPCILYEAALLVETGRYKDFDGLIVVDVNEEQQLQRAISRGMTQEQALARMKAQAHSRQRLQVATWIIDNNGSIEETKKQVQDLWNLIFPLTAQNKNPMKS